MKAIAFAVGSALAVLGLGLAFSAAPPAPTVGLKPASSFSSNANRNERAVALFNEADKVILHPRCVN